MSKVAAQGSDGDSIRRHRSGARVGALLKQVRFVLVRPQTPGNVGSTARVLTNFGFTQLSLVEPAAALDHEAVKFAVHGKGLLMKARRCATLEDAVGGDHVVMGMTRRLGHRRRHHYLTPEQACAMVRDVVASSRVSILFGPEDDGLSNDDLRYCHWLVTIPSPAPHNSMNLSHAVAVMAYELAHQIAEGRVYSRATASEMESFFQHLLTVLHQIRFLKSHDRHRMMMKFRHIFHRAGMDQKEVKTLHGVLSQIQYTLGVRKGIDLSAERPAT